MAFKKCLLFTIVLISFTKALPLYEAHQEGSQQFILQPKQLQEEQAPLYYTQHKEIQAIQPVPVHIQAVHKTPVYAHHKTEEHHEPAQYSFEYRVHDPHTGDIKSQKETRNGDAVKGYYTLLEADGRHRTVHYTADKHTGFNAVVTYDGKQQHPTTVQHHYSAHKYAAPVQKYVQPAEKYVQTHGVVPVQNYEVPVQKYEVPVQKYEVPVQKYELPVQKYVQPAEKYVQTHGVVPVQNYEVPVQKYEVPVQKYEVPVQKYEVPVQKYEVPVQKYEVPIQKYEVPIQKYEVPVQKYEVPVQTYEVPVQKYVAPIVQQKLVISDHSQNEQGSHLGQSQYQSQHYNGNGKDEPAHSFIYSSLPADSSHEHGSNNHHATSQASHSISTHITHIIPVHSSHHH